MPKKDVRTIAIAHNEYSSKSNKPYQDKTTPEYHYSGSFGVPDSPLEDQ